MKCKCTNQSEKKVKNGDLVPKKEEILQKVVFLQDQVLTKQNQKHLILKNLDFLWEKK
jgi:hypothetical protein